MPPRTPNVEGRVTVAGRRWEIVIDPDVVDDDAFGVTIPRRRRIALAADPDLRTVLHELLHASEEGLDTDVPHDTVAALAAGLASALLSRPELARWVADAAIREARP